MEEILNFLKALPKESVIFSFLLTIGIIINWLLKFFSNNLPTLQFFIFRRYRFQRLEAHSNILESLEFINDPNLNQLHLDIIKEETFEKITRLKFYGTKKRELFIELYPKLKNEFAFEEIHKLRSHFLIKEDKIYATPKPYFLFQNLIFFSIVLLFLWLFLMIISSLSDSNNWFSDGLFWTPLLIFIMITLMRVDTIKKVRKLRLFLEKYYKK